MQSNLGHLENINVKNLCPVSRRVGKQITISGIYTAKYQDILHDEKLRQQKKAIKQYNSAVFQAATLWS